MSAAVHQLRASEPPEQTEVELWPEKGESYDDFMYRCQVDLSVCIGPDAAVETCDSKWRQSEKLGKKTVGPFITKRFDLLGSAAVEACGTSCVGCSKEDILRKARATIAGAKADLVAARGSSPRPREAQVAPHQPEDPVRKWRREAVATAQREADAKRERREETADARRWADWSAEVGRELAGQAEVNQDLVKAIGAVLDSVARGSDRLDELERENKKLWARVKTLESVGKSKLILPHEVR